MNDQQLAGKKALLTGLIFLIPAIVPSVGQYLILKRTGGGMLLMIPVLGLLALYLIVAGAIQWKTGKGGIKVNPHRSMRRFGSVVAVATILLTALFVWGASTIK
jgi:uncharacterized membrane protein YdbT with pleckstrin-like domain